MSAVPYSAYLKVVGAFVVVIGFVEIGVGAEVWAFLPGVRYGCWWGAMVAVAAGIAGLIANDKKTVQLVAWLSAFASILLFAGMLVDSLGFRRVNDLQTCVNGDTNEVYGASGYQPEAAVCAAGTNRLCGCVGHVNNFACHTYDINEYRQQNCGLILTRYTDLLLVSLVFDTFTLAWAFTLSVMSCASYSAIVAAENPTPAASPKKAATETELVAAPAATESPAKSEVAKTEDDAPDAANKV